jgi:hypothetical protein
MDGERFIAQCKLSRAQVLESKSLLRRIKELQDEMDRRPEMLNEDIINGLSGASFTSLKQSKGFTP